MTTTAPTRESGLKRLEEFLPFAGRHYTERRNQVPGIVSGLAPYIRHRLITEAEVVAAVLQRYSALEAEKFIQEVCWRTYWKGWLEMRPLVWFRYQEELHSLSDRMARDPDFQERVRRAEYGETGLHCLDDWACELRETGYLHNHVRMWFASIWVHTLRLPWQLGADFLMRHLLDGDPASNTLSWRWVCGLQTKGKIYQATAENIERYTNGRYAPQGLFAGDPDPITEDFLIPQPLQLTRPDLHALGEKTLLLVTQEDLSPESWGIPQGDVAGIVLINTAESYCGIESLPLAWKRTALLGTTERLKEGFQCPVLLLNPREEIEATHFQTLLSSLLQEFRVSTLTIMDPAVGTTRSLLDLVLLGLKSEGITVRKLRRAWDDTFWPHATNGFFKLKERIPALLKQLSISS